MAKELFIPKLGQTVEEVRLVRFLVEDGAKVDQGQEVLEVETDKAVFAVETPAKGYIHFGPFKEDTVLPVLTVVATVGKADEKFAPEGAPAEAAPVESVKPVETPTAANLQSPIANLSRPFASPRAKKLAAEEHVDLSKVTPTGGGGVRVAERDVVAFLAGAPKATPVAERMAAEAGIDLRALSGSGVGGAITKEDVQQAIEKSRGAEEKRRRYAGEEEKAPAAAVPATPVTSVPAAPLAGEPMPEVLQRIPLKGVRGIIAERMAASAHTVARVTIFMDVDATELVALRERLKAKVSEAWGFTPGYNDLLIRVTAAALRKFPYMNARITADAIEVLGPVHIGMAVDTDRGLLVPVVRDADRKNLRQIGGELRELIERARKGRSLPSDFGGTFTITSLGPMDVDGFTPIINVPEAAILGVGRIAAKPVIYNGEITARKMMTLSLAFDHRVSDGAPSAKFLKTIKELIEEPYLLLAE
ncbi:MAG: 2-oxo acid dehydrogenase subunit E2 [Chloroflexi bacterium]|nr:2-oxo acid dehydrogenase subunit E2 [Chloroflexota bacterium]MCL5275348.1 2-oxo acid dehydrogenase subunit E2 [Chloroflexota bacterium]